MIGFGKVGGGHFLGSFLALWSVSDGSEDTASGSGPFTLLQLSPLLIV
mgnify:FL=1